MSHHREKTYKDKRKPAISDSEQLRHEIENLEDALILHARFQSEHDNSVKAMIRKELGTTYWEHGGEGKLTTYRSGKDLCNQGLKLHTFHHIKTRSRKKQHTVSGGKEDDISSKDTQNSFTAISNTADKKNRKLVKMKSPTYQGEQQDTTSNAGELSELKITSIKVAAAISKLQEVAVDVVDNAIMKTSSLKNDTLVLTDKMSHGRKIKHTNGFKRHTATDKCSKNRSHNRVLESSPVVNNRTFIAKKKSQTDSKLVDMEDTSQLFVQEVSHNFTSAIQLSCNSKDTNYVVNEHASITQDLNGRFDTCETLFGRDNFTDEPSNKQLIHELLNCEFEQSISKKLEESGSYKIFQDKKSCEFVRPLSTNHIMKVDSANKWAIKSSDGLFVDLKGIKVPGNGSHLDDDCGDFVTDLDAPEKQQNQTPLKKGIENICLLNGDSCEKEKQRKEKNEDVTPVKDCYNIFSTLRTPPDNTQAPVLFLTSMSANEKERSEMTSPVNEGVQCRQETESADASYSLLHSDVNVAEQSHSDVSVIQQSHSDVSVAEQSHSDVTVAEQSHSDVSVAEQSHSDVSVIQQSHSDVIGIQQSHSDVSVIRQSHSDVSVIRQSHSDMSVAQHSYTVSSFPEADCPSQQSPLDMDLKSWLHSLGLESVEHYVQLFNHHQLDMSCVQLLTPTDLRKMGIHDIGPIMKIMKGVLVLGRNKDSPKWKSGSSGYAHDQIKQKLYSENNCADTNNPTKTSQKLHNNLKNSTIDNKILNIEYGAGTTWQKIPPSPDLQMEPGQASILNSQIDARQVNCDITNAANLKISHDCGNVVYGVSHAAKAMTKASSKAKSNECKSQASGNRRVKQSEMGTRGRTSVSNIGQTVFVQKLKTKQKQTSVTEGNKDNITRQRQLQTSELNTVPFRQKCDKDGIYVTEEACKVQNYFSHPKRLLVEQGSIKFQHPNFEQDGFESMSMYLHPDDKYVTSASKTKTNVQERKEQQEKKKQNFVDEEKRLPLEKEYTFDDQQMRKFDSHCTNLPHTREHSALGIIGRKQLSDLQKSRSNESFISFVAVDYADDLIDTMAKNKGPTVESLVKVQEPKPKLLKSKRSQSAPLRNKNIRPIKRQQNGQLSKGSKAGISYHYILDNTENVELNRNVVVFSENDLLGSGSFSQVFKGTYQGSDVAVKRLHIPLQTRDLNYFVSEISFLQSLRHPHVARILGVCGACDQFPLIVMEYLTCGNLHSLLHGPGRTGIRKKEFLQIAHDVSSGMLYLHNHQPPVLHLDLKPKNILIGHRTRAKVAGFGFSKLRCKDGKLNHSRKSLVVHDKLPWMAPEMLTPGEITAKVDVYSFGMVLWEMLTRQCPYEKCSVFQVLEQVQGNRRPSLPADCPERLSQIVCKCWDQNPAARPGFKEIVKYLEHLSDTCEWNTLSEVFRGNDNDYTCLKLAPGSSPTTEYSLKERSQKYQEETSCFDHIDFTSLFSKNSEENNSGNEEESKFTSGPLVNNPDRSRQCGDELKFCVSIPDIQVSSGSKNKQYSTNVEQSECYLQHSHRLSKSCLSLSVDEDNNDNARHKMGENCNEIFMISNKPIVHTTKSQDSIQISQAVQKLLPLRHSIDKPKVMPALPKYRHFKQQGSLDPQIKSQINCRILEEAVPARMCKYMNTSIESVESTAPVDSTSHVKRGDILNSISANEDDLQSSFSEDLPYRPSFYDQVILDKLTTRLDPSWLNTGYCSKWSSKDQSSAHRKVGLPCGHEKLESFNSCMKSVSETHDCISNKVPLTSEAADKLLTAKGRHESMNVANENVQIQTASLRVSGKALLDKATKSSILNSHKLEQMEVSRSHLLENNSLDRLHVSLDNEVADSSGLPERMRSAKCSISSSHERMTQGAGVTQCNKDTAKYGNSHSSVSHGDATHIYTLKADDHCTADACLLSCVHMSTNENRIPVPTIRSSGIQFATAISDNTRLNDIATSRRSDDIPTSTRSDGIPTSTRPNDIATSRRSDDIPTSTRSDGIPMSTRPTDIPTSRRSDDIPTSTRSDDVAASTRSDDVQTFTRSYLNQISTESDHIQTSKRSDDIHISEMSDDTKVLMKFSNISVPSAGPCDTQASLITSDDVHIPSAISDSVEASIGLSETSVPNAIIGSYTQPNTLLSTLLNMLQSNDHQTTAGDSDSDTSTVSDISQDSLNKDAAPQPRSAKCSGHGPFTINSPNAFMIDTGRVLKVKNNQLTVENKETRNSVAYNPDLTDNQGFNAQLTFLQPESRNKKMDTELAMAAKDIQVTKEKEIYSAVHGEHNRCLAPDFYNKSKLSSFKHTKSHAKTLQEECLLRNKLNSDNCECQNCQQLKAATKNTQNSLLSSPEEHSTTEMEVRTLDTNYGIHSVNKHADFLPWQGKQLLGHSHGTSHFSIDAGMLRSQKKLLRPVMTTVSQFSVNTLDASQDKSPSVITILKKAMSDRRFAMADSLDSQDLTSESSWSVQD